MFQTMPPVIYNTFKRDDKEVKDFCLDASVQFKKKKNHHTQSSVAHRFWTNRLDENSEINSAVANH